MWRVIRSYLLYTWGGLHRYFGNQNSISHEFERAVHYFTRAYRLNPNMTHARFARAVILWRELGRLEEALADFNALLKEDPDDGPALLNRALIRQQTGAYPEALTDIRRYLALPPDPEYRDLAERLEPLLQELTASDAPNP